MSIDGLLEHSEKRSEKKHVIYKTKQKLSTKKNQLKEKLLPQLNHHGLNLLQEHQLKTKRN